MPAHDSPRASAQEGSRAELQRVATNPAVFVIADLHLGDKATCANGRRPFRNVDEMEAVIERLWNATVRPEDTVYVLGDLGRRQRLQAITRLNGRKHLVAGNADNLMWIVKSEIFATVAVARWLPGFLLTHIPVHPTQLRGRMINVHGHLHTSTVHDPRYRCVSVEQTGFAPLRLSSLAEGSGQTVPLLAIGSPNSTYAI